MTLCLRLKIHLSMRSINSPGKRKSILKFKKTYCKYLNLNALKTSWTEKSRINKNATLTYIFQSCELK